MGHKVSANQQDPISSIPADMRFWECWEDNRARKAGRLSTSGWRGICVYPVSQYERVRIASHIAATPQVMRIAGARFAPAPGDPERPRTIEFAAWFRRNEDFESFRKMLEALPPRTLQVRTKSEKITKRIRTILRPYNWLERASTKNGTLLIMEDNPTTRLVAQKVVA